MKITRIIMAALILIPFAGNVNPGPVVVAVSTKTFYSGTTPCAPGKSLVPVVPANDDCEHMKWHLTLFNSEAGIPASYVLTCQYRGANSAGRSSKTVEMKGSLVITKGIKSNPEAVVYELRTERGTNVLLVKMSDDLLHILDADRRLMVGNPAWSYTLNRVTK